MKTIKPLCLALAFVAALVTSSFGQVTINLGDHVLRPNEAGQAIPIQISTGSNDEIIGGSFFIQIAGSGPLPSFNLVSDLASPGGDPAITAGGTFNGAGFVFENTTVEADEISSAGLPGGIDAAQVAFFSILAGEDEPATGVIAMLEVDTTGVDSGSFQLIDIQNASSLDSNGGSVAKSVTSPGSITIAAVPEPSSIIALGGLGLLLASRRRR